MFLHGNDHFDTWQAPPGSYRTLKWPEVTTDDSVPGRKRARHTESDRLEPPTKDAAAASWRQQLTHIQADVNGRLRSVLSDTILLLSDQVSPRLVITRTFCDLNVAFRSLCFVAGRRQGASAPSRLLRALLPAAPQPDQGAGSSSATVLEAVVHASRVGRAG